MNEPEDRPTPSSRPAPLGDPPEDPRMSQSQGGPPADAAEEPLRSFESPVPPPPAEPDPPAAEPEARWEDVVDPAPTAPPATSEPVADDRAEPSRAGQALPADRSSGASMADDDEYGDEDYEPALRWVSLLATIGTALIGIVTVQVLTSLVEGLTLRSEQRVGVPDDLFHRLGYPFGGLGATALVFLVLGVVLVSMPGVLDELLSESQDRVVGVALFVAIAIGVLIAIGSLLAVRANLHEYAAKNVPVPTYVRVQFTNFLLGSLGAAALALFGSIASMNERSRDRL